MSSPVSSPGDERGATGRLHNHRKGYQRQHAPDECAERQLRIGVTAQSSTRPPHQGQDRGEEHTPRAEDEDQTHESPRHARRVQREVDERGEEREGRGRERVGEQNGA